MSCAHSAASVPFSAVHGDSCRVTGCRACLIEAAKFPMCAPGGLFFECPTCDEAVSDPVFISSLLSSCPEGERVFQDAVEQVRRHAMSALDDAYQSMAALVSEFKAAHATNDSRRMYCLARAMHYLHEDTAALAIRFGRIDNDIFQSIEDRVHLFDDTAVTDLAKYASLTDAFKSRFPFQVSTEHFCDSRDGYWSRSLEPTVFPVPVGFCPSLDIDDVIGSLQPDSDDVLFLGLAAFSLDKVHSDRAAECPESPLSPSPSQQQAPEDDDEVTVIAVKRPRVDSE